MPNEFSYFVLIVYPLFGLLMFRWMKIVPAAFVTILLGHMFLPVGVEIDFPGIPSFNKGNIPSISALLGCIIIKGKKIKFLPIELYERFVFIFLLVIPFFTVLNNQEAVFNGSIWIQGLTLYDSFAVVFGQYFSLLAFLLALQLVKSYEDQIVLFKISVVLGALYSLFIIFEIRISPQLHTWVYGFFPHSFAQQMRFGGFRAVVFMGHGLTVAMFVMVVLGASLLLWKVKIKSIGNYPILVVAGFVFVLVISKSVTAIVFGVVFIAIITMLNVAVVSLSARLIMAFVILYPALIIFNLFPYDLIVDFAYSVSPDRAKSLDFRFFHEQQLLEHARQKFLLGWGSWGRNRLSGSVTDGYWIIKLGQYGLLGFLCLFSLPLISVNRALKAGALLQDRRAQTLMVSFALLVAIIMVDQLPNSSMGPWLWFLIGGLLGSANSVIRNAAKNSTTDVKV
jgi:hypothetical protein